MQYYNFSRLITKYKSTFKLITYTGEHYDDYGEYVKGEKTETDLTGAIISIRESEIYRSQGTLTAEDRHLFMLEPIKKALEGAKVVFEEKTYSIEDCTQNAQFTGVWQYTLKYVSAFN